MPARDRELQAIGSMIELLKRLDASERARVLEYVLKRLEMGAVQVPGAVMPELAVSRSTTAHGITDIRTLTVEKQPRSANEMVALIAYYLSELAPDEDRAGTVNVDTVRRYFKLAGFPMPRVPRNALTNAAAAGYLENVSRGEYRLNPVGYNLVVHGLPRSSAPGPGSPPTRRKARHAKRKGRHT